MPPETAAAARVKMFSILYIVIGVLLVVLAPFVIGELTD